MSRKNLVMLAIIGVMLASVVLPLAFAEEARQQRGQRGQGGTRGPGGGGYDFQARMNEMFKEELGATDNEWKVIEPRLTKVTTLQRDSSRGGAMGMMMGRMMRGGRGTRPGQEGQQRPERQRPGAPAGDREQTAVQKAQEALTEVLDKKDAPADEISAKLLVLRKAREKSKQDLAKAQKALKDVLTVRQEAKLVLYGLLP